jgi:predicted nuclease of predicted toxin-antitoxin system
MKILIDMNLSPSWVAFFKQNDIESVHWSSLGDGKDEDELIFDYARVHDYIVFTNDTDFGTILAATNANAPSVFQIRTQNLIPKYIGHSVLQCLIQFESELKQGCLIILNNAKSRVRILPLH